MKPILEAVINISTADIQILNDCISIINRHPQVILLDVHRGVSVNRSVLTICGTPVELPNALMDIMGHCFAEIDMSCHTGTHPRIGAVDVCPIIPVRGISFDEALSLTERLATKASAIHNVPIYMYERSARTRKRRFLYNIRRGGYEGLENKIKKTDWIPDFGPSIWSSSVAKTGAMVMGVRDYMVAWNLSLTSNNLRLARQAASKIRGTGRVMDGTRLHGRFSSVRAIGWIIDEYACAQISMNIYNVTQDLMMDVYDFAQQCTSNGIRYTERIGLFPLDAFGLSSTAGVDDVKRVAKMLQIQHFKPKDHILEYAVQNKCDIADFSEDYPCLDSCL